MTLRRRPVDFPAPETTCLCGLIIFRCRPGDFPAPETTCIDRFSSAVLGTFQRPPLSFCLDFSRGSVVHGPGWKQFIGNKPLNVSVHGLARSPSSMSLENMIRNTLLGNEGSTPRAKGMQAVSGSKICEGHVSRISQSLQNASSSKGVRPGLI